jgi:hypothetical protein
MTKMVSKRKIIWVTQYTPGPMWQVYTSDDDDDDAKDVGSNLDNNK